MPQESKENQVAEDPRVRFAGERTLLAWIRTGLSMMGFGFVVARFGVFLRELGTPERFSGSTGLSLWIGAGLILLGIVVNMVAGLQHIQFLRRLHEGRPFEPPRWSLAVATAFVLVAVGIGMVAYLLSLPSAIR